MGVSRTAQFFWVPPIISGTGKATNFKFCTHILSIDRNKSPLQISRKVGRCVVRTLETYQGTHILGASRGLCDSSAVLLLLRHQCLICPSYRLRNNIRMHWRLLTARTGHVFLIELCVCCRSWWWATVWDGHVVEHRRNVATPCSVVLFTA